MAKAIIYFCTASRDFCSADRIFVSWARELAGESMGEVLQCAQEVGELDACFAVKYPTLLNMQLFELHLLT